MITLNLDDLSSLELSRVFKTAIQTRCCVFGVNHQDIVLRDNHCNGEQYEHQP
jgi:hypothetical protein